jgi:molybdopterin-guanine dinucleotide biosynthesis protein A
VTRTLTEVTGLVLAGGRSARMGGADKGLQPFHGEALAHHAARRLDEQVAQVMVSANQNLEVYRGWKWPVFMDTPPGHLGPLAGFVTGLGHCTTPWLMTCPCDSPLFPLDLVDVMLHEAQRTQSRLAVAVGQEHDAAHRFTGELRIQPVFCLIHRDLEAGLRQHIAKGVRKITDWLAAENACHVLFDRPQDRLAFLNVNSPAELLSLERLIPRS